MEYIIESDQAKEINKAIKDKNFATDLCKMYSRLIDDRNLKVYFLGSGPICLDSLYGLLEKFGGLIVS